MFAVEAGRRTSISASSMWLATASGSWTKLLRRTGPARTPTCAAASGRRRAIDTLVVSGPFPVDPQVQRRRAARPRAPARRSVTRPRPATPIGRRAVGGRQQQGSRRGFQAVGRCTGRPPACATLADRRRRDLVDPVPVPGTVQEEPRRTFQVRRTWSRSARQRPARGAGRSGSPSTASGVTERRGSPGCSPRRCRTASSR